MKKYTCPMHPEIKTDKPGQCPKCGMDLEEMTQGGHGGGHMGPEAAKDFLKRFYIVTFLLLPLLLLTKTGLGILGLPDFSGRNLLQFADATLIFYFALVFFEHAKHEIRARQFGMMTLVSLAVGSGYLFSAASTFLPAFGGVQFYLEISTLIWVLLFGHYLEAKSSSAAGDALQEVAKLLPKQAHLLKDKTTKDVDLESLRQGDVVLVKPGEKVPADGIIMRGKANMDEALISGESTPVAKKEGEKVVAGSICLDGSLEIKLEKVGENSTIGQIQNLIAQAQQTKPTMQKIADRAASILTFSALTVALITILIWSVVLGQPLVFSLTLAITVLVIACPHALGLAIPTVSTIATSLAVKNGLFIKDLAKLERVKDIDYVILDKTGTLTKGEFGVAEIINLKSHNSDPGKSQEEILRVSATLEQHSSHMIGLSIVKYAKERKMPLVGVDNFKNLAGKGVEGRVEGNDYWLGNKTLAQEKGLFGREVDEVYKSLLSEGKTIIFLGDKSQVWGVLTLSDQIKEESYGAIRKLHDLSIKVAMLTGDSHQVAENVAKKLKIDKFFAEVLPEDKYKYVRQIQEKGDKVMMVGDGVNDAPAITQADVGVAVGAGTDVAVEAGDIVLTRNNPEDIVNLVVLSRKVYGKMLQNLLWATGYNILAIPAAAGLFSSWGIFLRPEFGAILMSLSSVIVVFNALTLRKAQLKIN